MSIRFGRVFHYWSEGLIFEMLRDYDEPVRLEGTLGERNLRLKVACAEMIGYALAHELGASKTGQVPGAWPR